MAIKLADEIIEEIKNRRPAAVTDASANGDEYERWLYEEDKEKFMNKTTINGKAITCSGTNVVIDNGKVIVDGNIIQECNSGDLKVIIEGNVNKIDCDGSVEVHGNSGNIDCGGSCEVGGDVEGDINAGGSITCGNVSGDIDAGGSVRCRR